MGKVFCGRMGEIEKKKYLIYRSQEGINIKDVRR